MKEALLRTICVATVLLGAVATSSAGFSIFPVKGEKYNALQCRPEGEGRFPAVVYNHGSIVDAVGLAKAREIGNKLDEICAAIAKEGFVAFFPIREKINAARWYADYQPYYMDVVNSAIDHVKTLDYVDPARVNLMGHSMGGLLTLLIGEARKDMRALIVAAPASKNRVFASTVYYANEIHAPILLMVERSDAHHIHKGVNDLESAFKKYNKAAKLIRYDQGGGHNLFFTVDYYWPDVVEFLKANN